MTSTCECTSPGQHSDSSYKCVALAVKPACPCTTFLISVSRCLHTLCQHPTNCLDCLLCWSEPQTDRQAVHSNMP